MLVHEAGGHQEEAHWLGLQIESVRPAHGDGERREGAHDGGKSGACVGDPGSTRVKELMELHCRRLRWSPRMQISTYECQSVYYAAGLSAWPETVGAGASALRRLA